MRQIYRILVLGGYGTFGARICHALSQTRGIVVIVAGRSIQRAYAFAEQLGSLRGGPGAEAAGIDTSSSRVAHGIRSAGAQLVIHTAGPFQQQDYRVASACIAAGAHYLDLADSREFVCGIERLQQAAKDAGVLVVSGVSSVPALAAAAIDHLLPRFKQLDEIFHCICPGNRSPKGEATTRAILSYAGKAFERWEEGRWITSYGWQDVRRFTFDGVGPRWCANCDVPDLELFPARYAGVRTVRFQAGIELTVLHLGLAALSWLPRLRVVRSLAPAAPLLLAMSRWFDRLGSDVGAMAVALRGIDFTGEPLRVLWQLIAPGGVGPGVPALASVILARKLAAGTLQDRGAMPCVGMISLDEFTAELEKLGARQVITSSASDLVYDSR